MVIALTTRKQLEANFKRTLMFLAIDGHESSCVLEDLHEEGLATLPYPEDSFREEMEARGLDEALKEPNEELQTYHARLHLLDPQVPEHYKQHLRAYLEVEGYKHHVDDVSEEQIRKEYEHLL